MIVFTEAKKKKLINDIAVVIVEELKEAREKIDEQYDYFQRNYKVVMKMDAGLSLLERKVDAIMEYLSIEIIEKPMQMPKIVAVNKHSKMSEEKK
jgi:hypothetical protein